MAEFYLDVARFLCSEQWTGELRGAQLKVSLCKGQCETEQCVEACEQPMLELQQFVKKKSDLYVKKGVEYCKHECWEAKNIGDCSRRCVKEYSELAQDFEEVLTGRLAATHFKQ